MQEYLLDFSGEDHEELSETLFREERKAKWNAMSTKERDEYCKNLWVRLDIWLKEEDAQQPH